MPHTTSNSPALAERPVWPAMLLAVPLAAAAVFCARQALIEQRASAALEASRSLSRPVPTVGDDATARELVYSAEALLVRALRLPTGAPEKPGLLHESAVRLDQGLALRPRWSEAWVIRTHLLAARQGISAPDTVRAFETSYKLAPFLRDGADWRLRYGLAAWSALSPGTREAVANEAIMLSRVSRDLRAHVRVLTSGTPVFPLIENRIWP